MRTEMQFPMNFILNGHITRFMMAARISPFTASCRRMATGDWRFTLTTRSKKECISGIVKALDEMSLKVL